MWLWMSFALSGDNLLSFDNYIVPSESGVGFQCTMCGKEAVKKSNLRKHIENIHFPGSYSYSCKYCSQICTTKNQLNQHISKLHRGWCSDNYPTPQLSYAYSTDSFIQQICWMCISVTVKDIDERNTFLESSEQSCLSQKISLKSPCSTKNDLNI